MGFLSFLFSFTVEYKDDIHANDIIKARALFFWGGRHTSTSTSFGWGKGGNVTSAGWQVTLTLCDPMWHVSSRSGVAILRTAIHLLLTYLLTQGQAMAESRIF